jgi:hypothetical protein
VNPVYDGLIPDQIRPGQIAGFFKNWGDALNVPEIEPFAVIDPEFSTSSQIYSLLA